MSFTKAELELRIAELEQQLAASHGDPRKNGLACLTGLLKNIKVISRPEMKLSVSGFLSNTSQETTPDGDRYKVDLPIDGIIATDNGQPIASQLLEISQQYDWAVVAVYGRWVPMGTISVNQRGFHYAQRRQLRAQFVEVLHAPGPLPAAQSPVQQEQPFGEPTLDPIAF